MTATSRMTSCMCRSRTCHCNRVAALEYCIRQARRSHDAYHGQHIRHCPDVLVVHPFNDFDCSTTRRRTPFLLLLLLLLVSNLSLSMFLMLGRWTGTCNGATVEPCCCETETRTCDTVGQSLPPCRTHALHQGWGTNGGATLLKVMAAPIRQYTSARRHVLRVGSVLGGRAGRGCG